MRQMTRSLTRKEFFIGASATAGLLAASGECNPRGAIDPNRVLIASDIHIPLPWSEQKYRTGREYPWIVDAVKGSIAEILALDPLPANFIALGDMSIAFGEEKEYAILRELLQPLYDRGIKVTLAMGNHDIRASYAKSFPEAAAQSLVPGRYVHKVETPHLDFIVLDSLKEPDVRGSYKAVEGCGLGKEQTEWAKAMLPKLTKPTILCAHHQIYQTGLKKEILRTAQVVGYLHGHHHHWMTDSVFEGYASNARTMRSVGIGSFGIDRDVGYAVMDVSSESAVLKVVAKDYYFPVKRPQTERPRLWDELVRDHAGRTFTFPLS